MHDLRSEKGFTLVEVLTAMFILSIGMLGVGTMIVDSIKADNYNTRVRAAEHLAVSKLEQLRGQSADSKLTAGPDNKYPWRRKTETDPDEGITAQPGQVFVRDCNVIAADANNITRVDVVVAWPADSDCVPGKTNSQCPPHGQCCKNRYRLTGFILQK